MKSKNLLQKIKSLYYWHRVTGVHAASLFGEVSEYPITEEDLNNNVCTREFYMDQTKGKFIYELCLTVSSVVLKISARHSLTDTIVGVDGKCEFLFKKCRQGAWDIYQINTLAGCKKWPLWPQLKSEMEAGGFYSINDYCWEHE